MFRVNVYLAHLATLSTKHVLLFCRKCHLTSLSSRLAQTLNHEMRTDWL